MGFKKVELSKEEEDALQGGNFFKFPTIGTKLLGRFVRTQPQTGQYAKADLLDYVFRARVKNEETGAESIEEVVVNTNKRLHATLKKCNLKPGYAVKITHTATQDVGQQSPMKLYDVEVDDSPAPAKAAAAPPPPPPPPAAADDDLPY